MGQGTGVQSSKYTPTGNNSLKYLHLLAELREEHRTLKLRWMGDGLIEVWENQPDPSLWRDQCDEELRNGMKDKWAEKEKEVGQMLDVLKNRNIKYSNW